MSAPDERTALLPRPESSPGEAGRGGKPPDAITATVTPIAGPKAGAPVGQEEGSNNNNDNTSNNDNTETTFRGRAKAWFGPANRILLAAFIMSMALGTTQVPILYAFRLMECQRYYETHPEDVIKAMSTTTNSFFSSSSFSELTTTAIDRCNRREVNAGTASQYSILGMMTAFSGVINLFVCGYFIKLVGPRWAFVSQTTCVGVRVLTQIVGITMGGRPGELIFQAFQTIGVIGGPRGYQLVLNTAVSEVVVAKERTAVFGKVQGAMMLGTAVGYLLGGVLGDVYGIRRPFETAFFLYILSTTYGALFMPTGASGSGNGASTTDKNRPEAAAKPKLGVASFFAPLKIIVPRKYRLESGQIITNYGLIFLAVGIFLGVFASGFAPQLLQMYATSTFNWTTAENGYLMFGNSLIRGLFLMFIFPSIIFYGRIWYNRNLEPLQSKNDDTEGLDDASGRGDSATNTITQEDDDEEDSGTGFDLFFVRWSLVGDAAVTFFAAFTSQGWQVYLAGFLLPFTSGSAPAAKGVMTEMCPPEARRDAISGITLVESMATLLTLGLFGMVYAAFAEMDQPSLTFFVNTGFAVVGFIVLFMARLPPHNSTRIEGGEDDQNRRVLAAEAGQEETSPLLPAQPTRSTDEEGSH